MLFDFKCPAGHVFEANVPSDTFQTPCKTCQEPAERQISVPTLKIPFNGDYPGASLKWARKHEKGSRLYD